MLRLMTGHELPRQIDLAVVCSVSCPGSIIIKIYDTIRLVRDAGAVVVGGFHSPMERECLAFLIRGRQPVVWVTARGLRWLDTTDDEQTAIDERRLVVASTVDEEAAHATVSTALERNEIIAKMASAILVPHAARGSKTLSMARRLLSEGRRVLTFDDPWNAELMSLGASTDLTAWLPRLAAGRSGREP